MQKPSPEQNQIKNSKEVQNHISKEIQKDNTDKKEGEEKELSHSQKYENSLEKDLLEYKDDLNSENTEYNKVEKKRNKTQMLAVKRRQYVKKTKKPKNDKKDNSIKKGNTEIINNSRGYESNDLLINKNLNPNKANLCKEIDKISIADGCLNKKRKREKETKINKKSKNLNQIGNIEGSSKSFTQSKYGDSPGNKYKGFKKKEKYFQNVKQNKMTDDCQDFNNLPDINCRSFKLYSICLFETDKSPSFKNTPNEEIINLDFISNMSTNHPRHRMIHNQNNLIMDNYESSLNISNNA